MASQLSGLSIISSPSWLNPSSSSSPDALPRRPRISSVRLPAAAAGARVAGRTAVAWWRRVNAAASAGVHGARVSEVYGLKARPIVAIDNYTSFIHNLCQIVPRATQNPDGTKTLYGEEGKDDAHISEIPSVQGNEEIKKRKKSILDAPPVNNLDQYHIIKNLLVSEAAMKNMQDHNTLIFIVDARADKPMIREALKNIFDVKVKKVNTLILPNGKKKAFVKLAPDCSAFDVIKKMGII